MGKKKPNFETEKEKQRKAYKERRSKGGRRRSSHHMKEIEARWKYEDEKRAGYR